jgi:hypothetical protein
MTFSFVELSDLLHEDYDKLVMLDDKGYLWKAYIECLDEWHTLEVKQDRTVWAFHSPTNHSWLVTTF